MYDFYMKATGNDHVESEMTKIYEMLQAIKTRRDAAKARLGVLRERLERARELGRALEMRRALVDIQASILVLVTWTDWYQREQDRRRAAEVIATAPSVVAQLQGDADRHAREAEELDGQMSELMAAAEAQSARVAEAKGRHAVAEQGLTRAKEEVARARAEEESKRGEGFMSLWGWQWVWVRMWGWQWVRMMVLVCGWQWLVIRVGVDSHLKLSKDASSRPLLFPPQPTAPSSRRR